MRLKSIIFGLLLSSFITPLFADFDEGSIFQHSTLSGTYAANATDNGLSKLVVKCEEGTYYAAVYAKCGTKDCQWKTKALKRQKNGTYLLEYVKGFTTKQLIFRKIKTDLQVVTIRTYSDGRPSTKQQTDMRLVKLGKPCR